MNLTPRKSHFQENSMNSNLYYCVCLAPIAVSSAAAAADNIPIPAELPLRALPAMQTTEYFTQSTGWKRSQR